MPILLRGEFDAVRLRLVARRSDDADQVRRLLALASIYDGARRTEAAAIGGVTLQVVRDGVLRFNEHGPDGLMERRAPGKAPLLNERHRTALAAAIESGPIPAVHGMVRWRIIDLCQSCATTGSPIASSPTTTPSSTTAATPGTSSSRSPGR